MPIIHNEKFVTADRRYQGVEDVFKYGCILCHRRLKLDRTSRCPECVLAPPPATSSDLGSDAAGQPTTPTGQSSKPEESSSQTGENSVAHSDPPADPPADPTSETDAYTMEMQRQLKTATQYPLPKDDGVSSDEGLQENVDVTMSEIKKRGPGSPQKSETPVKNIRLDSKDSVNNGV